VLVEEEVVDLDPDLVIAGYGFNDRWPVEVPDAEQLERVRGMGGGALYYLGKSRLLTWGRILLTRIWPRGQDPEKAPPPATLSEEKEKALSQKPKRVSPKEYEENLRAMCDILAGQGIRLILLDLFVLGPWQSALAAVKEQQKARVIDGEGFLRRLLEEVKAGDPARGEIRRWAVERYGEEALKMEPWLYLFNDNCHPNANGYALLARTLADELIPELMKIP
jgi:lysophospholipase L1-like esterase